MPSANSEGGGGGDMRARSGAVMMDGEHSFNAPSLLSSGDRTTVAGDSLQTAGETGIPQGFPQR